MEELASRAGITISNCRRAEQGLPVSITTAKLIRSVLRTLKLDPPDAPSDNAIASTIESQVRIAPTDKDQSPQVHENVASSITSEAAATHKKPRSVRADVGLSISDFPWTVRGAPVSKGKWLASVAKRAFLRLHVSAKISLPILLLSLFIIVTMYSLSRHSQNVPSP